jgi:hypothetical protein
VSEVSAREPCNAAEMMKIKKIIFADFWRKKFQGNK